MWNIFHEVHHFACHEINKLFPKHLIVNFFWNQSLNSFGQIRKISPWVIYKNVSDHEKESLEKLSFELLWNVVEFSNSLSVTRP